MRTRTRSLLPIMIGLWLWDLAVFLGSADPNRIAPEGLASAIMGAALVLPIALYGMWLLRKPEYRYASDLSEAVHGDRTRPSARTRAPGC
jgi:hypothetical protein